MTDASTRRTFLGSTLLATASASLLGPSLFAPAPAAAFQDEPALLGEVATPSWVFVVHRLQDPYAGEVIRPAEPEAGTRYVGAEVEIRNDSAHPLNFAPGGVRLQDSESFEYVFGTVSGSDPLLPTVNMLPGERLRGWVWYVVPEAAQLVELVYVAPAPRLVVPLLGDG